MSWSESRLCELLVEGFREEFHDLSRVSDRVDQELFCGLCVVRGAHLCVGEDFRRIEGEVLFQEFGCLCVFDNQRDERPQEGEELPAGGVLCVVQIPCAAGDEMPDAVALEVDGHRDYREFEVGDA